MATSPERLPEMSGLAEEPEGGDGGEEGMNDNVQIFVIVCLRTTMYHPTLFRIGMCPMAHPW